MGTRANLGPTEPVLLETSTLPQEPVQMPLNIVIVDSAASRTASSALEGLYTSLLRAPWRAAAIYGVAGFCYALVMTIIFLSATKNEFLPLRFLVLLWYYAWPIVITICLIAAATWRLRFLVTFIYFLILGILGAITISINSVINWG